MANLFSRPGMASTLVLLAATCGAAEPRFEVTPFIAYRAGGQFKEGVSGNTLDLGGSSSAALAFNWRATEPGTQYELLYSRQAATTDGAAPMDLKVEYLQVGGTTPVGEDTARIQPFAAGGIGAARFSPGLTGLSQETRWSLNLGGGVRVPVAQRVRLRFEARGYLTWLGGNTDLFCNGACIIAAKGKTFFQYEALGGVSVSF